MRNIGYKKTLKDVLKELGMPSAVLEKYEGKNIPELFQSYLQGNERSLDTLLAHNAANVIPLRYMAWLVLLQKLRFDPELTEDWPKLSRGVLARLKEEGRQSTE